MSFLVPEITEEKIIQYLKNPMLFRKEQFIMEASPSHPQGVLFGDVCQEWQQKYIFDPIDAKDENGFPKYNLLYIGLPKKMGKALAIDTPIITSNGWKLLKDIKEGDYVFDENGKSVKVLFTTDVMYNHKCYEITFSDNTKIIADENHLWTVWDYSARESYRKQNIENKNWPKQWWEWKSKNKSKKDLSVVGVKTSSTKEILKKLRVNKQVYNFSIPTSKPLQYKKQNLSIDPYVLGYLLGDGSSLNGNQVACHKDDREWLKTQFIKKDFLIGKYEDEYIFTIKNIYKYWRKLDLQNNKHIPENYLYSDYSQRISLIQGLFDSDGHVENKTGRYIFVNTNIKIINGLAQLLRSIGLSPKIHKYKKFLNGKICKDQYRLLVMSNIILVNLPRKIQKIVNLKNKKNNFNLKCSSRRIISIKEVKSMPVKCIKVDSKSSLFLAGEGMIPTHNTTVIGGQCIIQLLLNPRPTKENYLLGGDKDQANYLFEQTKSFIERNPNFDGIFEILKNEIIVKSTGAKLTILSSEAKTKHGKNPDWFCFDEFWNQDTRELWDSMWLGMAAKPHGQGIIITNAGSDSDSICYTIRELCKSGRFKNFYYFEPVGEELEKLTVPWISKDWVEMERMTLPANVFRRFRLNQWVSGGDAPFMPDEGWECFKGQLSEKLICNEGRHFIGIDLGVKKDAASVVVVHRDRFGLVVDRINRWKGSKENPVPISEIEQFIGLCLRNYSNCIIACDPWQAMGTIQKFQAIGIEVIEFFFTIQNLVKLSKNLFYLFKNMSISIPKHDILETELKGLQVIQKSYGWRIDHEANNSSDICMALGIASVIAMEKGIEEDDLNKVLGDLYYEDQSSLFKAGEKREFTKNMNISNNGVPEEEAPQIKNQVSTKRLF